MKSISKSGSIRPNTESSETFDYPKDVKERFKQYRKDLEFIDSNYAELQNQFLNCWVGVFREQVVGNSSNLSDLVIKLSRQGIPPLGIPMTLIEKEPAVKSSDRTDRSIRLLTDPEYRDELSRQRQKDLDFIQSNSKELIKQYPDQWVAVYREKLIAADPTSEGVQKKLEAQGIPGDEAYLEFVYTGPRPLFRPWLPRIT